jgi:type II secretory pathway pseudopilin PulG
MTVGDDIGVTMRGQGNRKGHRDAGYVMAALLVSLAVMSILMAVAMPTWRHLMQREREAELIFRGEQYARAIGLFQRKFAGAFPPSVDVLLQQKFLRKKYADPMVPDGQFQVLYQTSTMQQPGRSGLPGAPGIGGGATTGIATTSPGGAAGDTPGAQVGISAGQVGGPGTAFGTAGARGGVTGVVSKSTKRSIRLYKGRGRYNEWQFVYTEVSRQLTPTGGPAGMPGQMGPGGRQGTGPNFPRPGAGGGMGPGSMGPGGMGPGSMGPGGMGQPRPFGRPGGMQPMQPMQPGMPPQ